MNKNPGPFPSIRSNASDRPKVTFITGEKTCAKMIANPQPNCEGWSNSNTWTFSLYFLQEREAYEALVALIQPSLKKYGKVSRNTYMKARNLMDRVYSTAKMEPMDEEGGVNVREIVDQLAAELK